MKAKVSYNHFFRKGGISLIPSPYALFASLCNFVTGKGQVCSMSTFKSAFYFDMRRQRYRELRGGERGRGGLGGR